MTECLKNRYNGEKKVSCMKRTYVILISLIAVFLLSLKGVSANSALSYWEGTDAAGVMTRDEDCPVIVEHETLTFDLNDDAEEPDRFTAEYTFHNPSDLDVRCRLAFPFGPRPDYVTMINAYDDAENYHILVNGEEIEPVVRYTSPAGMKFETEEDLMRLQDDYRDDVFFRKDLPVYRCTLHFSLEEYDSEDGYYIEAVSDLRNDPSHIRYLFPESAGYTVTPEATRAFIILSKMEEDVEIFCFGEPTEFSWTYRMTDPDRKEAEGTCTLTQEELTYEEFVLSLKENDDISDIDQYNALTDLFIHASDMDIFLPRPWLMSSYLMKWYCYDLNFAPHETIINAVQAPSCPDIDANFEDPVCTYSYLLSPASTWSEFRELEVIVRSQLEMLDGSLEFTREDNTYRAVYQGLPEEELSFRMCRVSNPKSKNSAYGMVLIGFLVISALLFLALVWLLFTIIRRLIRRKK